MESFRVSMAARFLTARGTRSESLDFDLDVDGVHTLEKAAVKLFVAEMTGRGMRPTSDVEIYYWEVRRL